MARIMILEDDESVRAFLTRTLQREGHEVVALANGVQACDVQRKQPVDLVVADLFMPEKDGLETIADLLRMTPSLRVIAVSGGGGSAEFGPGTFLEMAARMGACRTLQKPFGLHGLTRCVNSVLDRPAAVGDAFGDVG